MNAVPSATSRSTLTRQWELLKLLPPKGPGITTLELQSLLSDAGHPTTKRTIERDLVELSRLFPLQCNSKGMPYGWHWMPGKSAELPGISLSEALTLRLVEDSIRPLIPAFMLRTLEPRFNLARQKLEAMSEENPSARWLDKVASVQPELSQTPPEIKADLLEIIQQALMNDTQLTTQPTRINFTISPLTHWALFSEPIPPTSLPPPNPSTTFASSLFIVSKKRACSLVPAANPMDLICKTMSIAALCSLVHTRRFSLKPG